MFKIERKRRKFYRGFNEIGRIKINKFLNRVLLSGNNSIVIRHNLIYILFVVLFIFAALYFEHRFIICLIIICFEWFVLWLLRKKFYVAKINFKYSIGKIYHDINRSNIFIDNKQYEIYSHGHNYFSIMRNDVQIGLIKADNNTFFGEVGFNCLIDCEDYENELIPLLVMFISYKYNIQGNIGGISYETTINFRDKHKERLNFKVNNKLSP